MDIEFHYYITYLTALKAGFKKQEAKIIATSAQLVDDNVEVNLIENHKGKIYKTYISQTANILKPKEELFRIYPIFHFIPGDPFAFSAKRKDGIMHLLNTTPNNKNARFLMGKALDSNNFYRIGIAAHTYTDTWAHQNFTGYYSSFNRLSGVLEKVTPNIGHADAKREPDLISNVWIDERLISDNQVVDNNVRFIEAVSKLLKYFTDYTEKKLVGYVKEKFLDQLNDIFSIKGNKKYHRFKRIKKYHEISYEISGFNIPEYEKYEWFELSVDVFNDENIFLPNLNYNLTNYRWKNKGYKKSPYYLFCEAIKEHQRIGEKIFVQPKYEKMELNKW